MSGRGWNPLGYDKGPLPPGCYQQKPEGCWEFQQGYGWVLASPVLQVQVPIMQGYPAYYAAYQQQAGNIAPLPYEPSSPKAKNRQTRSLSKPEDDGMPGINMNNPYGGTGNVPGFNYMFPAKHSPIIFIRSGDVRPWSSEFVAHASNPSKSPVKMTPMMVPSRMTVRELLKGCGATNEEREKNVVTEVVSQGNGQWSRGLCIHGGEGRADRPIESLGWDDSRKGLVGGKPYTYLYVTSDTKKADLK